MKIRLWKATVWPVATYGFETLAQEDEVDTKWKGWDQPQELSGHKGKETSGY